MEGIHVGGLTVLANKNRNGNIFPHFAIPTVIFSHVKISSFRAKAHLVFHWCLYNKSMSCTNLIT